MVRFAWELLGFLRLMTGAFRLSDTDLPAWAFRH